MHRHSAPTCSRSNIKAFVGGQRREVDRGLRVGGEHDQGLAGGERRQRGAGAQERQWAQEPAGVDEPRARWETDDAVAEIELFVFLLFAVARAGGPRPALRACRTRSRWSSAAWSSASSRACRRPSSIPDIVFFVFLPPLLYAAAITVSAHES